MKTIFGLFWCLIVFSSWEILAEPKKNLSLKDIFHPEEKLDFYGVTEEISWLKESKFYVVFCNERQVWLKIDAVSGASSPVYSQEKIEKAFSLLLPDKARAIAEQGEIFSWNPFYTAFVIEHDSDLYYYSIESNKAVQLTKDGESKTEISFSPDGKCIAFVVKNDLYLMDVNTLEKTRITQDGNEKIYNGILDWVYQEEIFGRGNFRGYWWSSDSQKIAFLKLDCSQVKTFTLVDDVPFEQTKEILSYPKAGTPNPKVQLGIFHRNPKTTVWADTSAYGEKEDLLLVDVSWNRQGDMLLAQWQNREQTWLDFSLVDISQGKMQTLFRETTPAWVNFHGSPFWLQDNSFLYLSERDGWKHIYQYLPEEKKSIQITSGDWEIREFYGAKESSQKLYFSSTQANTTQEHIYECSWQTKQIKQLSQKPGTHNARFSKDYSLFLDYASDVFGPTQIDLYEQDGKRVRSVYQNHPSGLKIRKLKMPHFLQVEARDRFVMEAMVLYPDNFNPQKKYPVLFHIYGGPQTPKVKNQWGRNTYLWHQMLAQKGYIVFIMDNRLASGKGAISAWKSYKNLGKQEMEDLEDGVAWLKALPYVNPQRIALWGWSFGGYLTCYALTHSKNFKAGIAVAPVTDWRNYDTVYTERYMSLPEKNPSGYDASSVLKKAQDLHGQLLLIHGITDDNVHFQNSVQFAYALQEAGKQFQLMAYPRSRHGISHPKLNYHLFSLMTEFLKKNL